MEKMIDEAMHMVHISIHALRANDGEMVKTLTMIEDEVDRIYYEYLDELSRAPPEAKCLISTVLVVRYLERIADHAIYIGESIYYIATGKKMILRNTTPIDRQ